MRSRNPRRHRHRSGARHGAHDRRRFRRWWFEQVSIDDDHRRWGGGPREAVAVVGPVCAALPPRHPERVKHREDDEEHRDLQRDDDRAHGDPRVLRRGTARRSRRWR